VLEGVCASRAIILAIKPKKPRNLRYFEAFCGVFSGWIQRDLNPRPSDYERIEKRLNDAKINKNITLLSNCCIG
jgi:hypothetical protein